MDFEEEPMDVDLSGNTSRHTDAMDISYNKSDHSSSEIEIKEEIFPKNNEDIKEKNCDTEVHTAQSTTVIKRFSLQRKDHKSLPNTIYLSFIFTILCSVTLLLYYIAQFECSKELDLEVLKKSLTKNLVGQTQAIERIINSLQEKSSSKILFFYGGTGVGKTLAISLILENHHHFANIYHYTMPSFADTFSTDLMLGLTICPNSMIIVDDLNSTDLYIKENIKKIVEKSENLNKNTTIILVFNCDTINDQYVKKCDIFFSVDLKKAFREIKAMKYLIQFNTLTEEHLRKCIEKELEGQGRKNLSDNEFKSIVKNFNVSVDGCKGVYTKIKSLNIN